jgi:hypothetical protein
MTLIAVQAVVIPRAFQGRRARLAIGIRFSVRMAVIAGALKFLASAAVRRLALATISLA